MDKFTKAYLHIINEEQDESTITVSIESGDDSSAYEISEECQELGIKFEQFTNSCELSTPTENKDALKKILLKWWACADGLDGALLGVKSSYPWITQDGEKIDFNDFFAEELAQCGGLYE